jgi:hypothetical protein
MSMHASIQRGELDASTDVSSSVELMVAVLLGVGLCAGFARAQPGVVVALEELHRLLVGKLTIAAQ